MRFGLTDVQEGHFQTPGFETLQHNMHALLERYAQVQDVIRSHALDRSGGVQAFGRRAGPLLEDIKKLGDATPGILKIPLTLQEPERFEALLPRAGQPVARNQAERIIDQIADFFEFNQIHPQWVDGNLTLRPPNQLFNLFALDALDSYVKQWSEQDLARGYGDPTRVSECLSIFRDVTDGLCVPFTQYLLTKGFYSTPSAPDFVLSQAPADHTPPEHLRKALAAAATTFTVPQFTGTLPEETVTRSIPVVATAQAQQLCAVVAEQEHTSLDRILSEYRAIHYAADSAAVNGNRTDASTIRMLLRGEQMAALALAHGCEVAEPIRDGFADILAQAEASQNAALVNGKAGSTAALLHDIYRFDSEHAQQLCTAAAQQEHATAQQVTSDYREACYAAKEAFLAGERGERADVESFAMISQGHRIAVAALEQGTAAAEQVRDNFAQILEQAEQAQYGALAHRLTTIKSVRSGFTR